MKLADLRKLAIRKQTRIRFPLANGMECVINERGVAQVPSLKEPPAFNLEEELASAATFVLEPVTAGANRNAPKATALGRSDLAVMMAEGADAPAQDHHEDE